MVCLPKYKSGRAVVCEMDGRWFVRLPDGKLIDCGKDINEVGIYFEWASDRAHFIAELLNVWLKWETWPPQPSDANSIENRICDNAHKAELL